MTFSTLAAISALNAPYRPCEALENGGAMRAAADRILSHDLLSPLVSGFLFPDLLQRFLPVPLPFLDRTRRLEVAFENAWDREVPGHAGLLQGSLFTSWRLEGVSPALVLNTTAVETGEQIIATSLPFQFWRYGRDIGDFLDNGSDMSISTASFLSARFPWLTPAGRIDARRNNSDVKVRRRAIHLVDGGYFDNSGTEIAKSIADRIRSVAAGAGAEKVRVKLIVLSGATPPDKDQTLRFGEFMAPIDTFLAVRERRTAIAQGRAEDETCSMMINFESSEFSSFRSCLDFGYDLPLGWRISGLTRGIIAESTALRGRCWPSDMYDPQIPKDVRFRMPNVCTIMEIMRDLNPRPLRN